jgi:hypothetical protein
MFNRNSEMLAWRLDKYFGDLASIQMHYLQKPHTEWNDHSSIRNRRDWVGDDSSGTGATGAGRLWTIGAASLATLPGGSSIPGTNVQAIFNLLSGPWTMGFTQLGFEPTFNADGTLTATVTSTTGGGVTTIDTFATGRASSYWECSGAPHHEGFEWRSAIFCGFL